MSDAPLAERCHPFAPYGTLAVAAESRAVARSLGTACIPQLAALLAHGSTAMRAFAVEMLAELDPGNAEARARRAFVEQPEIEVRAAAVGALADATSPSSLDLLFSCATEGPGAVRYAALAAIGRRREEAAVLRAIALAEDGTVDERVRDELATIVGQRAEPVARQRVRAWIDAETPLARSAVVHGAPDDETLWHALRSRDVEVRAFALRTLAKRDESFAEEKERTLATALETSSPDDTAHALAPLCARILGGDPEKAFDRLAPLVDLSTTEAARVARTEAVLWALDDRLADERPLSPRWNDALTRALAARTDDLATRSSIRSAEECLAGLRWLAGDRDPFAEQRVDLGEGDDDPFPFVVLGWTVDAELEPARAFAAGLVRFTHQTGGYSCAQYVVLGIPARLPEAMRARVRVHVDGWETWGEALTPPQLAAFDALLAPLRAPAFVEGEEAIVLSAPVTAALDVAALERITFHAAATPWKGVHWFAETPRIESLGPLRREDVAALEALGRALGLGAPRLVLLWGNSD